MNLGLLGIVQNNANTGCSAFVLFGNYKRIGYMHFCGFHAIQNTLPVFCIILLLLILDSKAFIDSLFVAIGNLQRSVLVYT